MKCQTSLDIKSSNQFRLLKARFCRGLTIFVCISLTLYSTQVIYLTQSNRNTE